MSRWNPFNGKKQKKGGMVELPARPTTQQLKQEHQRLTFLIGHNQRQMTTIIPRLMEELSDQLDKLEEMYEAAEARETAAAGKSAPVAEKVDQAA